MNDVFRDIDYGKLAYKKLGDLPSNFRLYKVERLGKPPYFSDVLMLTGCEFREAKRGPNKGNLVIAIKGTERTVYVSESEIEAEKGRTE